MPKMFRKSSGFSAGDSDVCESGILIASVIKLSTSRFVSSGTFFSRASALSRIALVMRLTLSPNLSFAKLFKKQLIQRSIRRSREEIDPARLAEFAETLNVIVDGLAIGIEPKLSEGHFLHRARFRIDQSKIAISARIHFFRRKNLDRAHLKPATD